MAKPDLDKVKDQSVQARARGEGATLSLLLWAVRGAELISPWWSKQRDADLRRFWKSVDHLAGAVYTIQSRLITIPFQILPRDKTVKAHVRQGEEFTDMLVNQSEFGEGWGTFYSKFVEDLVTQDGGCMAEIIGEGRPDGPIVGMPTGVAHLDSWRSTRTGDPEFPIVYQDTDGKRYKLHYTRVGFSSQMPSPSATMNGVGFCLHRDASVRMADGRYRRIVDVVRDQDPGPVLSLDSTGKLVHKRITAWYENPRHDRSLVNLRGKHVQHCRGNQHRNSWLTEDHPVLTPSGWRSVGELETGDEMITEYPAPNNIQHSLLVGMLLGDAYVQLNNKNARIGFAHKKDNRDWVDIKIEALHDFGWRTWEDDFNYRKLGLDGAMIKSETKFNPAFNSYRQVFYPNGKKRIPHTLLIENLHPILLATWYLDDGNILSRDPGPRNRSPRAAITTSGFSEADVKDACRILTVAGYECNPVSARGKKGCKNIYFTVKGSARFFDAIASYVPPSMRYKLPKSAAPYRPEGWIIGHAQPFIDEVIISKEWNKVSRGRPYGEPEHVYCIDVEDTHNFVSASTVVHNCAVSRCLNIAQNLLDILVYKQEKLGSRPHRSIMVTKGGLDPDDVASAFIKAESRMNAQQLKRYARTVVIGHADLPEAELQQIDLASLPDGFKEEESIILGMATIALAFGMDARELFPAMSVGATRAEALIQHMKQRGKGPGQILEMTERLFEYKVLPAHLKMVFDYQDDAQDNQVAEIRGKRAERHERDLLSGSVDVRTVREQMTEDGDLSHDQFVAMELEDGRLEDGTSVLTLFVNDDYIDLLDIGIADPLDVQENDREEVIVAIEIKRRKLWGELNTATPRHRRPVREALAALDRLEELYGAPMPEAVPEPLAEVIELEPEVEVETEPIVEEEEEIVGDELELKGVAKFLAMFRKPSDPMSKAAQAIEGAAMTVAIKSDAELKEMRKDAKRKEAELKELKDDIERKDARLAELKKDIDAVGDGMGRSLDVVSKALAATGQASMEGLLALRQSMDRLASKQDVAELGKSVDLEQFGKKVVTEIMGKIPEAPVVVSQEVVERDEGKIARIRRTYSDGGVAEFEIERDAEGKIERAVRI